MPLNENAPGSAFPGVIGRAGAESTPAWPRPLRSAPWATCGANPGLPVDPDYPSPFAFTGTLHSVTLDLSGDLIVDTESEMRLVMARQ